jgi:FixJ family two-component response regulator
MSMNNVSQAGQPSASVVYLMHDDPVVRARVGALVGSDGLPGSTLGCGEELFSDPRPDRICCAVLDVRVKNRCGLALQQQLAGRGIAVPLIFVTCNGDIASAVCAMKAGAVDFLDAPVSDDDLRTAILRGLERDRQRRAHADALAAVQCNYDLLTGREREVMEFVASGLMSKQAAYLMSLSEITVKIHRANLMRKMGAATIVDLVRMHALLAEEGMLAAQENTRAATAQT